MSTPAVLLAGVKNPLKVGDGTNKSVRGDGLGIQYVKNAVPTKHTLAEMGAYFTALNATPGTAIAPNALVGAFSDTNSFALIQNTSTPGAGGGTYIYPDFLRLILGTASTTNTALRFLTRIWPAGTNPLLAATPGTTLTNNVTNTLPNGTPANASVAKITMYANGNAFTTLASANLGVRPIDNPVIDCGVMVVNDTYILQWGTNDMQQKPGTTAARATDTATLVANTVPVGIGPGETLQIQMWQPSGVTAPAFEYGLGWWEL